MVALEAAQVRDQLTPIAQTGLPAQEHVCRIVGEDGGRHRFGDEGLAGPEESNRGFAGRRTNLLGLQRVLPLPELDRRARDGREIVATGIKNDFVFDRQLQTAIALGF
jgi:hypothetical protein